MKRCIQAAPLSHALAAVFCALDLSGPLLSAGRDDALCGGRRRLNEQVYRQKIIPAFEKVNNVKIVYVAGNSSDTLAKFQAQKGHQQINVAVMDDCPMYQAMQFDLCAQVDDAPVMQDLYPLAKLGPTAVGARHGRDGHRLQRRSIQKARPARPRLVAGAHATSVKGKLGVPPITNTYGLHTLVMLARMTGGGEKNIDPRLP